MKKQMMILAALFVAAVANAQSEVNIEKLWGITGEAVEINDPMTVKEGVAFIGDTRTPDKITDGKMKGMKVQKQKRFFKQGVMNVQYGNSLSFRGAPSGIKVDGEIDVNAVPRSRMVQVKPLSAGKLIIFANGTKEEVKHLYVGVRNGATFKNMLRVRRMLPMLYSWWTIPIRMVMSCGCILTAASICLPSSSPDNLTRTLPAVNPLLLPRP